jgi:YHS domain-containing protein
MKMSVVRQFLRPLAWTLAVTALYAGIAILIGMAGETTSRAATTERVVTDRLTGLALYGFDPVAYFTEQGPHEGSGDYELSWAGVTWRFRSEGNREAFMQHPAVYEPRFGGYDAVALGEGLPATGHPSVWAIHGERLYVFHSAKNRDRFASDPAAVIERAEARWPAVRAQLVP